MFAAIAGSYDLNNRVHSLWQDQRWRKQAVKMAEVKPGDVVVDVACGTGDLTRAFARTSAARVLGLDFTPAMLDIAKRKDERLTAEGRVEYREGDAMNLALPDGSADVVSIAFGLRNVADPARALAEFRRVLRPGGRLIVLEFDRPRNPVVRKVSDFYTGWLMPRTATLISRDRSGAYQYLPKSVEGFWDREKLRNEILRAGFEGHETRVMSLGVCVCHRAVVGR